MLWTSGCSPVVAGQDARFQCEVVAPTGSVLTLYKDGATLHREVNRCTASLNSEVRQMLISTQYKHVLQERCSINYALY